MRFAGGPVDGFSCEQHAWSVHAWDAIRELYADRPPDLVHFPDYLGEGFADARGQAGGAPAAARHARGRAHAHDATR